MPIRTRKDQDITITKKLEDGSSMTYKSPNGSQTDMESILGGMVEGYSPTPVADNVPANLTAGEFVINQPAAQKYKPLLEKINQEGRIMLQQGGYIAQAKPMGYAEGGMVTGPRGGQFRKNAAGQWIAVLGNQEFPVDDPSINEWLNSRYGSPDQRGSIMDANPFSNPSGNEGPQQYPEQVVLDPSTGDKDEFDRMDQLVRNGIYAINRDRGGRAIYTRTNLGSAHNTRAEGSGSPSQSWSPETASYAQDNVRIPESSHTPIDLLKQHMAAAGNREMPEWSGAKEDVMKYGVTGNAPRFTPEGSRIKYKSGQSYRVTDKAQAEQFVAAGIVAIGAKFITNDNIEGVAA